MNIALLGYGKMGKLIEEIAKERQHSITAIKDIDRPLEDYTNIDIGIDFSTPEAAFDNVKSCLDHGIPVVSGTTGWLDKYEDVVELCEANNGAFLYASNFSLGVNLFFALNSHLASMMHSLDQYKVSIEEIHHIHKLDAPSGTAITLAEDIITNSAYEGWKMDKADEREIPISSKRIGETPGTHTIRYSSSVDEIEIKHTAHSRQGFALGAVIAAEWLVNKKGVYSMRDVLNLG